MLIKKIIIDNFQCYAGTDNVFEFEKGINIIIGDNGSGKSKLYDAFYWLLYDQIFDSLKRQFTKTSYMGNAVVSDKAKNECEIGQEIKTRVVLYLEEGRNEYQLQRHFTIKKISKNEWQENQKSFLDGFQKDVLDFKPISEDQIKLTIEKLLPSNIQPYLWFQGEQVDELIDFQEKETLTKAINALSDIKIFDAYSEISEELLDSAIKDFNRELKNVSKNSENIQNSITEQEQLEIRLKRAENELTEINNNLFYAQQGKEDLFTKIEDAEKIIKIQEENKHLQNQLERLKIKLDEFPFLINRGIFDNKWLLTGLKPLLKEYTDKFIKYEHQRADTLSDRKAEVKVEQAANANLPINVPGRTKLEEMLEQNICFVCNRSLEEDEHAKEHIQFLIDRAKQIRVNNKDLIPNNFSHEFSRLSFICNQQESLIDEINDSITYKFSDMEKVQQKYNILLEKIKDSQQELEQLSNFSAVGEHDARNIAAAFKSNENSEKQLNDNKLRTEANISKIKAQIIELKNSIVKSDASAEMSEEIKNRKYVFEKLALITKRAKNRIYSQQIHKIEEEANKHFHSMTNDNKSARGKIILEALPNGAYMPKNVDDTGKQLGQLNDSNIILIKLSVIMAIVSAKGRSAEFYPLITDAPTSKFSDNYTISFCKTVGEVFSQCIIMSYDFYHNTSLRQRLFSEVPNLGTINVITPSINENERTNRNELKTIIKRITKAEEL